MSTIHRQGELWVDLHISEALQPGLPPSLDYIILQGVGFPLVALLWVAWFMGSSDLDLSGNCCTE